jgi:hypothetical protein
MIALTNLNQVFGTINTDLILSAKLTSLMIVLGVVLTDHLEKMLY